MKMTIELKTDTTHGRGRELMREPLRRRAKGMMVEKRITKDQL